MQDQVDALKALEPAGRIHQFVHGFTTPSDATEQALLNGDLDMLYVAP